MALPHHMEAPRPLRNLPHNLRQARRPPPPPHSPLPVRPPEGAHIQRRWTLPPLLYAPNHGAARIDRAVTAPPGFAPKHHSSRGLSVRTCGPTYSPWPTLRHSLQKTLQQLRRSFPTPPLAERTTSDTRIRLKLRRPASLTELIHQAPRQPAPCPAAACATYPTVHQTEAALRHLTTKKPPSHDKDPTSTPSF